MIRLLLVDDELAVRQGLRMRLALEPDVLVVGEARNGADALSLVPVLQPDVILLDLEMPQMDGISAARALRQCVPQSAVVILSLYDDAATRRRADANGAAGFVAKHEADAVLLATIRRAAGLRERADEREAFR